MYEVDVMKAIKQIASEDRWIKCYIIWAIMRPNPKGKTRKEKQTK